MFEASTVINLFSLNKEEIAMHNNIWYPQKGDNPKKTPTPTAADFLKFDSFEARICSRMICLMFFF